MAFNRWHGRTFTSKVLFFWTVTIIGLALNAQGQASPAPSPKHFDHVLIVVLENQNYESAIRNDFLKSLAQKGVIFSNFSNLYHYSYPNYLAMIAGSDFGTHKPLLLSDNQRTFNDDSEHRTIADCSIGRTMLKITRRLRPLRNHSSATTKEDTHASMHRS